MGVGLGSATGTTVGTFVISKVVVVGLWAVKLEISMVITAVGLGGGIMSVFVKVNIGVFVGAGGRELVLVTEKTGTELFSVDDEVVVVNVVVGVLVGSTTLVMERNGTGGSVGVI